jgi:hypothetical protein
MTGIRRRGAKTAESIERLIAELPPARVRSA